MLGKGMKTKGTQPKDATTNGASILKIKTQQDSVKREYGVAQPSRRKQLIKAVSGRISGNAPRKEQFGQDVARKINTMEYKKKQRNKMKKKEKKASVTRTLFGSGTAMMMRKGSSLSISDTSSDGGEPEKTELDVFSMKSKSSASRMKRPQKTKCKKRTVDFSHVHFREYDRPEDDDPDASGASNEDEDEDGEGFWYFSRESSQICVDYYERARQRKRTASKKSPGVPQPTPSGPVSKFGVPQRKAPQQYVIVWEDYLGDSTQRLERESENVSLSQQERSEVSSSVKSDDLDDETDESDDTEELLDEEADELENEDGFENAEELADTVQNSHVLC